MILFPYRTPLIVAKEEKIAKFMCDLISDQESKQLLLTEADYNAAHVLKEEIATLQPPSEEEDRTKVLNDWNTECDEDDLDAEDEDDCSGTDSYLPYDNGAIEKQDASIRIKDVKHSVS